MRQPVCVGCDGRELLTPNSVTAPLTEPHLNAHKRSPKCLRSTRSFTGGTWGGGQPRKAAKARCPGRGESEPSPKYLGKVASAEGFPPLGPCQPCRATSAPSGATLGHELWARELPDQHQPSCRRIKNRPDVHIQQICCRPGKGSMDSTSTRSVPRGARMSRSPARELLPPDNLGHCLKAKEPVQTGAP